MTPHRIALLAPMGLLVACSHNVQTPPSRPMSLAIPRTAGAGEARARFQVSNHGQVFGPSVNAGTLGGSFGIDERTDVSVDGSLMHVGAATAAGTNPNMYAGRVGFKRSGESKNLSVFGGVGGGYAPAAGLMASADGGLIVGYDNPYLVPFVTAHVFASAPFQAKEVDTSDPGDPMGTNVDTPDNTLGGGAGVGLSLVRESFGLSVGASIDSLTDADGQEVFFSLGAALEIRFGQ